MTAAYRWRTDIILFVAFCLTTVWCVNAPLNPNSVTRVGLSHAVAIHGQLNIDEVAPYTIDKAHWNGHYYCDKTPGISILCIPAVYVADKLANLVGAAPAFVPVKNAGAGLRYGLSALACLIATSILFAAAAVILFRRSIFLAGASERTADIAALTLAFGTPLFIWSTAVFGHATSTALLVMAFSLYWTGPDQRQLSSRRYALAGFILSLAALVELTAVPAAAMIGLLLLSKPTPLQWDRLGLNALAMLAAGLPAAAVLLLYNSLAFGSPFHLGYASVEGFAGMKSGFFGINVPTWEALWGITFSSDRGLFWVSPILLFSIPAIAALLRSSSVKLPVATCLGIAIYYLLLNGGYHYWNGGYSLGPRHLTPATPFLLFPIALWMDRAGRTTRVIVTATAVLSILITVVCTSVSFVVTDDGKSIFLGHLLPNFTRGHSDLVLATLHVPFVIVVIVPLVVVAGAAFLILGPLSSRRGDKQIALGTGALAR